MRDRCPKILTSLKTNTQCFSDRQVWYCHQVDHVHSQISTIFVAKESVDHRFNSYLIILPTFHPSDESHMSLPRGLAYAENFC